MPSARGFFSCALSWKQGNVLYPEANELFVGRQGLLGSAGGGGTGLVSRGE